LQSAMMLQRRDFAGTYAVNGGADKVVPVDLKIPGNPPSPLEIIRALHGF